MTFKEAILQGFPIDLIPNNNRVSAVFYLVINSIEYPCYVLTICL